MKFMAILLATASGVSFMPASTHDAQQVRYQRECREYKQRGVLGIGGTRLPTSDGRTLQQCRQCKITVRRMLPDKKECDPWPTLPNQ